MLFVYFSFNNIWIILNVSDLQKHSKSLIVLTDGKVIWDFVYSIKVLCKSEWLLMLKTRLNTVGSLHLPTGNNCIDQLEFWQCRNGKDKLCYVFCEWLNATCVSLNIHSTLVALNAWYGSIITEFRRYCTFYLERILAPDTAIVRDEFPGKHSILYQYKSVSSQDWFCVWLFMSVKDVKVTVS